MLGVGEVHTGRHKSCEQPGQDLVSWLGHAEWENGVQDVINSANSLDRTSSQLVGACSVESHGLHANERLRTHACDGISADWSE